MSRTVASNLMQNANLKPLTRLLFSFCFLFYAAVVVEGSSITLQIAEDGTAPQPKVEAVFYDYDKTLVVNSFGEQILLEYCDPGCDYDACTCTGLMDMSDALTSANNTEELVTAAFGGPERIDRLMEHYKVLQENDVNLYIMSTSWYQVPAEAWTEFIWTSFEYMNLADTFYRNKTQILALDDPGPGLPADKGSVVRAKVEELGLSPSQAIFADDSTGNVESSIVGDTIAADTLYVQPRTGLQAPDFDYIESRVTGKGEAMDVLKSIVNSLLP